MNREQRPAPTAVQTSAQPSAQPPRIVFTNRQLFALLGPLFMEQFLAIGVGLADSMMVATVGDAAISAVSLVDSISNLMIYIFTAMAAGGAAVAGQYIGRREQENASNAGQHLVLLVAGASLGITALLYLFKRPLLRLIFGQIEPEVMAAVETYFSIVTASIPAIALYNGGAAIFRTMGRSDVSLKVSLMMNLLNIGGNALLIFGFGMGVEGAAIPTLASRTAAAALILFLLSDKSLPLHIGSLRTFSFQPRLMRNILYIGIPSGAENGMFQLGRLALYSLISTFGTASIVANAIGNTLGNFHCFAGHSVALGAATVISQCVGAGEFDEARRYLRKLMKIAYVLMTVSNLLQFALLPLIMRVYDVSPEGERLAVIVTLIHGTAAILLWNPSFIFPAFLRSAGDARYTMLVSMGSMWLCRVLCAYILGKYLGFGIIGVWCAHALLDWSARSVLFYRRYRSGKWTEKGIQ